VPITVILDMKIKPEFLEEAMTGLKESMAGTLGFDGCEYVHVNVDAADPTRIVLVEGWESDEIFASYGAYRAERGDAEVWGKYYDGAPSLSKLTPRPDFQPAG
jgi:quinol monooxygenase YgiN